MLRVAINPLALHQPIGKVSYALFVVCYFLYELSWKYRMVKVRVTIITH